MARTITFGSPYDEVLYADGPATMFTVDAKGWLRADLERTREIWLLLGSVPRGEAGHYVLTDRVTGLRLYVLATGPLLITAQLRADWQQFPDQATAWAYAMAPWQKGEE